jgi:hypothetical protein
MPSILILVLFRFFLLLLCSDVHRWAFGLYDMATVFLALLALDFGLSHSLFLLIEVVMFLGAAWFTACLSSPLGGRTLLFHPDDCACLPAMGVLVCILMLALLLWRPIFNNAVMVFGNLGRLLCLYFGFIL